MCYTLEHCVPGTSWLYTNIISLFFNVFISNWRIISLQYCVAFCHTSRWISIGIHMSSPSWTSLPSPTPPHPLRWSQSSSLSTLSHRANLYWLFILHMVVYMFPCYPLHLSIISFDCCTTLCNMEVETEYMNNSRPYLNLC